MTINPKTGTIWCELTDNWNYCIWMKQGSCRNCKFFHLITKFARGGKNSDKNDQYVKPNRLIFLFHEIPYVKK